MSVNNILYTKFLLLTTEMSLGIVILANTNEQLYSWTFKVCKVVQQQTWCEMADFIPAASALQLISKW